MKIPKSIKKTIGHFFSLRSFQDPYQILQISPHSDLSQIKKKYY